MRWVGALKARGHQVLGASRHGPLRIDFMAPVPPAAWAARLRELQVDAVVNCVGILMARGGQSFERVHTQGPGELFPRRGRSRAGAGGAGVGAGRGRGPTRPTCAASAAADELLLSLPLAGTVLRPSLLVRARLPEHGALRHAGGAAGDRRCPGDGAMPLQPLHVYELAEMVARCVERRRAGARRVRTRCVRERR